MPGERYTVEVGVELSPQPGRFSLPIQYSRTYRIERLRSFSVEIPPGKCALQVLDRAAGGASGSKFIYLEMVRGREGVQWWPIASTTPRVDPNTRAFGPLFDWNVPSYSHAHGALSSSLVVSHAVGVEMHGGSLPVFQSYPADVASPGGEHAVYLSTLDGPTPDVRIHHRGRVATTPLNASDGNMIHTLMLLLGPDAAYNLGTHFDSLGFTFRHYIADGTLVGTGGGPSRGQRLAFYSYPFVEGVEDWDLIPATTPAGDVVWSAQDRNLCIRTLLPAVAAGNFGWSSTFAANGLHVQPTVVPLAPAQVFYSGYQASVFHGKATRAVMLGAPSPNHPIRSGINDSAVAMGKVTMMTYFLESSIPPGSTAAHLINVDFGPRPGLLHELRPYSFMELDRTDLFDGVVRSIGLRNPSPVPAVVNIVYAGNA